ncbi:MAG: hypothetical protein PSV35_04080, partial [bacterium]|nr:hypothetical protein [bacterium]
ASNAKPYHSLNLMAGPSVGKHLKELCHSVEQQSHHYNDHGSWDKASVLCRIYLTNKRKEKITTKKMVLPWRDRLPYND